MSETQKPNDAPPSPRALTTEDGATIARSVGKFLNERFTVFEKRLEALEMTGDDRRVVRDEKGRIERLTGGSASAQELRDRVASLEATITTLVKRVETAESAAKQLSYQGVWSEGVRYRRNNYVTHGGGLWFATDDMPTTRPGGAGWRLAVKKGAMSP